MKSLSFCWLSCFFIIGFNSCKHNSVHKNEETNTPQIPITKNQNYQKKILIKAFDDILFGENPENSNSNKFKLGHELCGSYFYVENLKSDIDSGLYYFELHSNSRRNDLISSDEFDLLCGRITSLFSRKYGAQIDKALIVDKGSEIYGVNVQGEKHGIFGPSPYVRNKQDIPRDEDQKTLVRSWDLPEIRIEIFKIKRYKFEIDPSQRTKIHEDGYDQPNELVKTFLPMYYINIAFTYKPMECMVMQRDGKDKQEYKRIMDSIDINKL